MEQLEIEKRIGVVFRDKNLLIEALTHRSFFNEFKKNGSRAHNERLEFLGDAVLQLVITEFLFTTYSDKSEGDLSIYRSTLVNRHSNAKRGKAMGLNDFLFLSKGELQNIGRGRETILGDAFEAVIGAIFVDQGYFAAKSFITKLILVKARAIIGEGVAMDSKSRLQHLAQKLEKMPPVYRVIATTEEGPNQDKQYHVGVFFGSTMIAEGQGPAKKLAEQKAAEAALKAKGWNQ